MSGSVTPKAIEGKGAAQDARCVVLHRRATDPRLAPALAHPGGPAPLLSLDGDDGFYAFLADWTFGPGTRVTFADLYGFDPEDTRPDMLFRLTLHLDTALTLGEIFPLMDAWLRIELRDRGLQTLPQDLDCAENGVFYFTF